MEDLPLGLGTGKAFCGIGGIMFEILGIKTRREKKAFVKAVIGGTAIMACVYVWAWISYVFAPSYYGW